MTGRRLALLAAAAVGAGAACILLGLAVLRERDAIARDHAALAAPRPSLARLGGNPVGALLVGDGGERAALRAAADRLAIRSRSAASHAEGELASLAAAGPAQRRSWAATLVATLELGLAQGGGQGSARHVAAARGALEEAVAEDPANEAAKRDLELLLALQQQAGRRRQRHQQKQSGKPAATPPAQPRAGVAAAGSGW
jgi:hypothetical protein